MADSVFDLIKLAHENEAIKNGNNPLVALANGYASGIDRQQAEIQQRRQAEILAEIEMKKQQQQLDLAKRETNLMNASQRAKSNIYNDNSIIGRASVNVANPTYASTKLIKSPAVPSNAIMSLVGGGYGDINANPIPQTPMQDLGQTALAMAPQAQSDPQEDRYSYGIKYDNGKVTPDIQDNQKEQQTFDEKVASAGVNPNNADGSRKNRTQILSEVAIKKNKELNPYVQMQLEQKKADSIKKRTDLMANDLDPNKYRQGSFGVSKNIFDRAERLQSLASAFPDNNLDSRQIEELAIGMNSMLAGSNVSAVTQVQNLIPKSIWGNTLKLTEWLSNNPHGTQQQAFVERMLGTIQREKDTASSQIKRTMFQRLSKYQDIKKNNPDEWDTVLRSAGIDPQEYENWKSGGYNKITAVQGSDTSSGGGSVTMTSPDGKSYTFSADQADEARANGWK